MPLTQEDKIEIRSIISDGMAVIHATTIAQNEIINLKLDGLTQRMDKINGRIGKTEDNLQKHEQIINDRAIVVANYMDHLKEGEEIKKRVRTLEDSQLTQKTIRKWIISSVALTGVILGALYTLSQLIEKM